MNKGDIEKGIENFLRKRLVVPFSNGGAGSDLLIDTDPATTEPWVVPFTVGSKVRLTTTGALPAPLAIDTDYFVVAKTETTLQLSATKGGAAIVYTAAGDGAVDLEDAEELAVVHSLGDTPVPEKGAIVCVILDNVQNVVGPLDYGFIRAQVRRKAIKADKPLQAAMADAVFHAFDNPHKPALQAEVLASTGDTVELRGHYRKGYQAVSDKNDWIEDLHVKLGMGPKTVTPEPEDDFDALCLRVTPGTNIQQYNQFEPFVNGKPRYRRSYYDVGMGTVPNNGTDIMWNAGNARWELVEAGNPAVVYQFTTGPDAANPIGTHWNGAGTEVTAGACAYNATPLCVFNYAVRSEYAHIGTFNGKALYQRQWYALDPPHFIAKVFDTTAFLLWEPLNNRWEIQVWTGGTPIAGGAYQSTLSYSPSTDLLDPDSWFQTTLPDNGLYVLGGACVIPPPETTPTASGDPPGTPTITPTITPTVTPTPSGGA